MIRLIGFALYRIPRLQSNLTRRDRRSRQPPLDRESLSEGAIKVMQQSVSV